MEPQTNDTPQIAAPPVGANGQQGASVEGSREPLPMRRVGTGDLVSLREIMAREEDVKIVVRLEPTGTGRFRYLIETPFATFPKFVIGTTDAKFDDVRIEMRCGLLETAEAAWPRHMAGERLDD